MVELEFSVLSRPSLERRIPSVVELQQEIEAWEQQRNQNQATVNGRFSTVDARTKFSRLYPNPSLPQQICRVKILRVSLSPRPHVSPNPSILGWSSTSSH